ncbi:MAG: FtsX-like permease family protein [Treponema sp.]|nr:FtsX-like permease family protein [Treponema sp.]
MAFAVFLFCIANAIFDSTEDGVEANYVSSFTGDLVIRPSGSGQNSLFGDETPVTGELTKLNLITPYKDLIEYLNSVPQISGFTGQITGAVAMEYNGGRIPMYLFGVNGMEYMKLMPAVKIQRGESYGTGEKGIMISDVTSRKTGIKLGDTIQFTVSDGPYFRIRAATVTAIYKYDADNEIFKRFVLVDPATLRSLMDISDTVVVSEEEIDEEKSFLLDDDLDWDSLFEEAADSEAVFEEVDLNDFQSNSEDVIQEEKTLLFDSGTAWNNIIVRLEQGCNAKKEIRKLNRYFKKAGWPLEATDWRHAAGSTALYLHWMRLILNTGIMIILFAGFIIVNNTLIVNVLDRTKEIGTMRAIGAKKRFISAQCMLETFMMTLSSGVIGTFAGFIASLIINKLKITFTNAFLIQLFGAEALHIHITEGNIFKLFILVVVLGFVGWIYPVFTAIKITPVKAMQGGK